MAGHFRPQYDRSMCGRRRARRFSPAFVLLVALVTSGWAQAHPMGQAASFEDHILRAQLLLDTHKAEEALEPLGQALALKPASEQALALMAMAHLQLGRFQEGLPYAQALARHAPKKARPHVLLAVFNERLNEADQALAEYRTALGLDPGDEEALSQLQRLSANLPAAPARLEIFKAIAREHPKEPRALLALGVYYRRMELPLDAVESFEQGLRLKESVDAHHQLGITYAELRVFEPALRHFDRALELHPGHLPSLYAKGVLYSRHEEPAKALSMYAKLLEQDPQNALVRFRVGEIHESESRLDKAEAEYRAALRRDPRLEPARFRLGALLLNQGRLAQARAELSACLRLDPHHGQAHLALARVLDALDQPEAAEAHFEAALRWSPMLTNAYLSYGNFLMRRHRRAKAQDLLRRFAQLKAFDDKTREWISAIDFRPDDRAAKRELIEHLLSGDRLGLALKSAYRFVASKPAEALYHRLLAKVYTAMERLDAAAATLEGAVKRFPDSVELHRMLGEVYLRVGRPRLAEREMAIADELARRSQ